MGYSFRLPARVLLYAPSHRLDSTYHSLCYISRGALAGTRNSSMGPPPEGSIRRPIAPWANAFTTELHLAPACFNCIERHVVVLSVGNPIRIYYVVNTLGCIVVKKEGRKELFYLTTHSTHFIYGYMASDIWLRTIVIVRMEIRCRHIGYSLRLTARVLLYVPCHRHDSTYHSLSYTSCGALAGTRNSSTGSPHEGSNRRPIAPWANAFPTELHLAPQLLLLSFFYLFLYFFLSFFIYSYLFIHSFIHFSLWFKFFKITVISAWAILLWERNLVTHWLGALGGYFTPLGFSWVPL